MLQMRPHQGDDVWSTPSSIDKTFEALALNSTPNKKFKDEVMKIVTADTFQFFFDKNNFLIIYKLNLDHT